MTQPPRGRDGSPSVGALAVQVDGLRRDVESLAAKMGTFTKMQREHATALNDISELRHQVEQILAILTGYDDASPATWFWLRMREEERTEKFSELSDWAETMFRVQYPDYLADQIRPCWPNHPEAKQNPVQVVGAASRWLGPAPVELEVALSQGQGLVPVVSLGCHAVLGDAGADDALQRQRKASTASRGFLPGKGDQHGDPGDRRVAGVLVLPGIPLGQELLAGDAQHLSCGAVQHGPAFFAGSLHYLDPHM